MPTCCSRDTGHSRDYGRNPYYGYDRVDQSPFLFQGRPDDRLLPMERVAALVLDGQPLAFPFRTLEREGAVNYEANGRSIVVLFQPGTASALDQSRIAESRDVGATGVFDAELDGQMLTFRVSAGRFRGRSDRLGVERAGASGIGAAGRAGADALSFTATTSGLPGPPSRRIRRCTGVDRLVV